MLVLVNTVQNPFQTEARSSIVGNKLFLFQYVILNLTKPNPIQCPRGVFNENLRVPLSAYGV
jgi:hypothetical protein